MKPDDPSYLKFAVLYGQMNLWLESYYQTFVPRTPGGMNAEDVRIKLVPEAVAIAEGKRNRENPLGGGQGEGKLTS
jgi:hypothetical protein